MVLWFRCVLPILVLFAFTLPAHAAEAAGEEKGNPVFPTSPEAFDLGVWTLLFFLALLFILHKFAWQPILQALKKREANIRAASEEAKLARKEADKAQAEFEAERKAAYAEIPRIMEAYRKEAERARDETKSKALTEIQQERQKLRDEVEGWHQQALQDIQQQAAQLAALISEKAVGWALDQEEHRKRTEEAISEMATGTK